ncbi:hypothetical protein A2U01_0094738, partial [Trifolium medium]|nr:hypothetical protein [Trifolium medium]
DIAHGVVSAVLSLEDNPGKSAKEYASLWVEHVSAISTSNNLPFLVVYLLPLKTVFIDSICVNRPIMIGRL